MKKHFYLPTLLLGCILAACTGNKPATETTAKELPANVDTFSFHHQFNDVLYKEADMAYTFDNWKDRGFKAWKEAFLDEMRHTLGLSRIKSQLEGFKPTARQIDTKDMGTYTRERWIIQTEPTVPLPIVILRPKDIQSPLPLVITPHGHGKNTEQYAGIYTSAADSISGVDGERNVAVQAVMEGYIAIAPTARGFGQTRTPEDKDADAVSSCRELLKHDLLVGRTPIGDRVWDNMKIIDWALENLPVDSRNIIVTGNSGGGTTSLFTGAMDERVSMSIPASYFCTFEASIGSLIHCDCNYLPGILNLGEMYDIAGLTAPRIFRSIQGEKDKIFPIEGSRKAFGKLQEIYAAAGVPDKCSLWVGPEGHRYYKAGVWEFVKENLAK